MNQPLDKENQKFKSFMKENGFTDLRMTLTDKAVEENDVIKVMQSLNSAVEAYQKGFTKPYEDDTIETFL